MPATEPCGRGQRACGQLASSFRPHAGVSPLALTSHCATDTNSFLLFLGFVVVVFFCFVLFFETGFLCIALAVLAWNSEIRLPLPPLGLKARITTPTEKPCLEKPNRQFFVGGVGSISLCSHNCPRQNWDICLPLSPVLPFKVCTVTFNPGTQPLKTIFLHNIPP